MEETRQGRRPVKENVVCYQHLRQQVFEKKEKVSVRCLGDVK